MSRPKSSNKRSSTTSWRLNLLSKDRILLIWDRICYVKIKFASRDQIYYVNQILLGWDRTWVEIEFCQVEIEFWRDRISFNRRLNLTRSRFNLLSQDRIYYTEIELAIWQLTYQCRSNPTKSWPNLLSWDWFLPIWDWILSRSNLLSQDKI